MKEIVLRAKLRKYHDRRLEGVLRGLSLQQGEMSDIVRKGVERELVVRGVIFAEDDLHCLERREQE